MCPDIFFQCSSLFSSQNTASAPASLAETILASPTIRICELDVGYHRATETIGSVRIWATLGERMSVVEMKSGETEVGEARRSSRWTM